jgi:intein-encoded DNA endonuclease-like protein
MPHAKQLEVFWKVVRLKKQCFGYETILKKIWLEDNVNLELEIVSGWFSDGVKMVVGENRNQICQKEKTFWIRNNEMPFNEIKFAD